MDFGRASDLVEPFHLEIAIGVCMRTYDAIWQKQATFDQNLAALIVLTCGTGLVILFSASWFIGERLMGNGYYFFTRQLVWALVGGAGAWVVSRLEGDWWRRAVPALLVVTIVLMLLPLLPVIGRPLMGARRWIILGPITFQPSELLKLTMILYVANFYSRRQDSLDNPKETFIPPMIVVLVLSGLCLFQNDFSAAVFSFVLGLSMMFAAGLRLRFLLPTVVIGVPIGIFFLFVRSYRVERLMTYFNPYEDPSGAGYQILSARKALANGGLFGVGPGAGVRKLGSVPEIQADFIAAVIGEEFGLVGIVAVFIIFGLLAFKSFQLVFQLKKPFESLVAAGIGTSITFQFLINMGVVSGALPATGVPLPFFSSGGSSLFINLVMMGILLSLSRGVDATKRL